MKELEVCEPVKRAESRTLRRSGLAITDFDRQPGYPFRLLEKPNCRLARLRPVSSAYSSWRGTLTLSPEYRAHSLGWPVLTAMHPGLILGPDVGLPRWEAERAFEGLISGEARYLELATYVLQENAGFILELPEGLMGVVVAADKFDRTVEIGEPVHLTEIAVPA